MHGLLSPRTFFQNRESIMQGARRARNITSCYIPGLHYVPLAQPRSEGTHFQAECFQGVSNAARLG